MKLNDTVKSFIWILIGLVMAIFGMFFKNELATAIIDIVSSLIVLYGNMEIKSEMWKLTIARRVLIVVLLIVILLNLIKLCFIK